MRLLASALAQDAAFTSRLSLTANLDGLKPLLTFLISPTVTYSVFRFSLKIFFIRLKLCDLDSSFCWQLLFCINGEHSQLFLSPKGVHPQFK